jgi:hypothetical protein
MAPKRDAIEEAHFRIDELVRENAELRRRTTSEFAAGIAHGAVKEFQNKYPNDPGSVVAALLELAAAQRENTAAQRELIAIMSAPSTRESTINLPSGPVHMTVHEKKDPFRPWQPRKQ